jgi:neopullulanase
MWPKYSSFFVFLLALSVPAACHNFIGNPHRHATPPRMVPVGDGDLRVEPANWWIGMRHRQVEILVHRSGVGAYAVRLGRSSGVRLVRVDRADSPNYLFVTLDIDPKAKEQKVPLIFSKGAQTFTHEFPILQRPKEVRAQGVDARDAVYLLMPDRFANGDPSNDIVPGMLQNAQRDSTLMRHGGDLKGISDHLDYIADLGFTTLWLNPELENDQARESYHGYALTDHYRVDRRLGTNEQLRDLVRDCHRRGMKVVRDVVLNHIGDNHYWMKDLPYKDWINQWPEFTRTTYRAPVLVDPYASEADRKLFNDGWFDTTMPDLNQRNPHLATYLIQQAIWWVEYAGFDDLRIDTYTYSDQAFASRWCKELREEYPKLNMFGEIWEHGVVLQGFFADDQPMKRARFDSNLPGVIDFQVMFALWEMLNKEQGWTEGAARVYYTLAQDYFYQDPYKNLIMLDNHDFTRFYTTIGENFTKFKSGMAFLATMRGIPQVYYMTEILGAGNSWPNHDFIRKDFPGGWPGDTLNKFVAAGRTAQENEALNYTRNLLQFRKKTPALQYGKMMQFVPADGIYTFFRYDTQQTVMVVINSSNKDVEVDTKRFSERMSGFTRAREAGTGQVFSDLKKLPVPANSPLVLELLR